MKCRFIVSVDTEEDVWGWKPNASTTCENIRELPRLARFLARLGIRPTFFVAYQVLSDPSALAVIRDLATEDWVEIGCHVHPWNTPPYDDLPPRTMLHTYPHVVQAAKIAAVTRLFQDELERSPVSFRAGRFGFGSNTAACLIDQGYRVDSSVTPFFDWHAMDGGQSYLGAPLEVYHIGQESGVLKSTPNGPLIEVPLTCGYTRLNASSWKNVATVLDHRAARAVHLGGLAARALGLRKAILSPEPHSVWDMVALSRRVLQSGVGHLQLFFHSSSLVPGLTPFARTSSDVGRLYDRIDDLMERLQRWYELGFVSVSEAADLSSTEAVRPSVQENERLHRQRGRAAASPGGESTGLS